MLASSQPRTTRNQLAAPLPPPRTWTPEIKVRFLDRLALDGNVRSACRAVGFSPESAYRQRRIDPLFARGWASAVLQGRENNTQVLAERAIGGIDEDVWFRGELVGTRRRYDNRLLLAHLARLDRMAERMDEDEESRFEELLACIAGEQAPGSDVQEPLPDRESYIEMMELNAADDVAEIWRVKRRSRSPANRAKLEREQGDAAMRAGDEAQRHWDEWLTRAHARVDAITGRNAPPPARGLPGNPLSPAPRAALAPFITPEVGPAAFALRTMSYASTSPLAHTHVLSRRDKFSPPRAPC